MQQSSGPVILSNYKQKTVFVEFRFMNVIAVHTNFVVISKLVSGTSASDKF